MNKNLKLLLAATIATSFAVSAHDKSNALVNSSGHAYKGNFDQCIESEYNSASTECGAPAPVAVAAPKPVAQIHTMGFALDAQALFDTNKSVVRSAGRAQLDELAGQIQSGKQLGKIKNVTGVTVVGHTDSRGSNSFNQALSERRAASVRSYLVNRGVSAELINAYGEGETNPAASNSTRQGRQQNRRVEVNVSGVAVKK